MSNYKDFKEEVIKIEEDSLKNVVPDKDSKIVAAIISRYEEEFENDNK